MKKRLILGDIHGHFDFVQEVYDIEKPDIVICLGDYVDSFVQTPEQHKECVENLLKLREKHNEEHGNTFHLCLGNHDFHYIIDGSRYSGFKFKTKQLCGPLLRNAINDNKIEIVYIDNINHTIYSHAGVSQQWIDDWCSGDLSKINTLDFDAFEFTYGDGFDSSGDNKYNSPIWIRPRALGNNMFVDKDGIEWRQVVGHTQTINIVDFTDTYKFSKEIEHPNLILCDCFPFAYIVEYLNDDGTLHHYDKIDYKPFDANWRQ